MKNETFEKCYDTFRSFLVKDADFAGEIELPKLGTSCLIPEKLVTFSKASRNPGQILIVGLCSMSMM